jgi:tetratricopeptide (TPR) repeat protein
MANNVVKKPGFDGAALVEKSLETVIKNRVPFTVVGGILILAILIAIGVNMYISNNAEKSAQMYDQATSIIQNLQYVSNVEARNKYYQEQMNNLNYLIQQFPSSVAATRARLYLARVNYEGAYSSGKTEYINSAIGLYSAALANAKTDFYRALACIGLAACYEQKSDFEKAFENYSQILIRYPKTGFNEVCLIGMARAKEMKGDINAAIPFYQRVIHDYTNSLWVRYAKGKIYSYMDPSHTNVESKKSSKENAAEPANTNLQLNLAQ